MKQRPEYNKKLIGKNLRRCRVKKNLSVENVKEYLHIGSIQAIYKWEEGKSYPQTDTMFALMELYEIELKDLLLEEETVPIEDKNVLEDRLELDKRQDWVESEKDGKIKRLLMYFKRLVDRSVR